MVAIEQCPTTLGGRTSRSDINKCPSLDNYHCLKTEDGQLRELCTSPIWIEAGRLNSLSLYKSKKTAYIKAVKHCFLTENFEVLLTNT